jgi:uncharacterized membrane protein (UPF0136 family)
VLDSAVGGEMSAVNARLFYSPYFRSVDDLLLLATFRVLVLLEWPHWLALVCTVALVDVGIVRSIKTRQFLHHSPEAFGAYATSIIVLVCATVLALVLQITLPPLLWPAVPESTALLTAGALRNFHSRGT